MRRILIVEKNEEYNNTLSQLLRSQGYETDSAKTVIDAFNLFKEKSYDLLVTDYLLDDLTGVDLFKLIRKLNNQLPKLIMTDLDDPAIELEALNENVVNFMKKPLNIDVFLKRIQLLLTSEIIINPENTGELLCGVDRIKVDTKIRRVYKSDRQVPLTTREYDLLVYLMSNSKRIVSRHEILQNVWHFDDLDLNSRSVDVHIRNLRKKLDITVIRSYRGTGYEWII